MLDTFKQEVLTSFTDSDGFVTVDRNPTPSSTGNGMFHLMFFCVILSRLKLDKDMKERVKATIESCRASKPGLFHRNKTKGATELNPKDEYRAIACLSFLFNLGYAKEICEHGESSHFPWSFDNQRLEYPQLNSWHGHNIGTVEFYKFCSGRVLSLVEVIAVISGLLYATFSKDSAENIWAYCFAQTMRSGGIFLWVASMFCLWRLKKKHSTLGQLCKPYFTEWHVFARLPWVS